MPKSGAGFSPPKLAPLYRPSRGLYCLLRLCPFFVAAGDICHSPVPRRGPFRLSEGLRSLASAWGFRGKLCGIPRSSLRRTSEHKRQLVSRDARKPAGQEVRRVSTCRCGPSMRQACAHSDGAVLNLAALARLRQLARSQDSAGQQTLRGVGLWLHSQSCAVSFRLRATTSSH